jgi:hypothetical protein
LTVSDSTGKQLFNAPVTMRSVYARDSTSLIVGLPQQLQQGEYHVAVELSDPETKVKASGEATVSGTAPATPAAPAPIQILEAVGTPRPSADDVQFLDIAATINNSGEPLTNVKVVLHVTHDGEVVEDFALASSLALPDGSTLVQQRYIPGTGWSKGTWQFTLSVEAVDPGSGVAQVLATADLADVEIS